MEHSCFCKGSGFSASQEILRILWIPNVHHRIHNSPPTLYPEPNKCSARPSLYFCKTHFNIMFPSKPRSSKCSLSSRLSNQTPVFISLLPAHATFPAHLIFLRLPQYYFVWITNHEAPHYAVFSILLLPPPSYAPRSSSAPSPRTPSAYVLHSMRQTNMQMHFVNKP